MNTPIKLAQDTIDSQELNQLCTWIQAGNRLTKDAQTLKFEQEFADWMSCDHAVFVNSGSSANLLMIYAQKELGRLRNLKAVAPAVSWVTTVSPFLQFGFDVELCDCDPENLGLDLNHLEDLFKSHQPSVLILVHVLGHANHMTEILDLCEKYQVILLEDSCEALGSEFKGQKLGTFGNAGSFSFYFGHHISTIEGGMVVTDDPELNQMMLSLRSHGWSRDLDKAEQDRLAQTYQIDPFRNLYTFYRAGFNLRSTDLQAFIGRGQLKKLNKIGEVRQANFAAYHEALPAYFAQHSNTSFLSSFAYGTLVENRLEVADYLTQHKIESRPLICGNIARHPFWINQFGRKPMANADKIHDYGIYLPNHHNLSSDDIAFVTQIFGEVARPKF